jgi:polyhydroxyalkanoate synthase subunit PhaC
MASEIRAAGMAQDDIHEQASEHTLAANPLVGIRGQDILESARMLLGRMAANPAVAARQYLSFLGELGRIATGGSELAPDPKDKRFADPAWKDSFPYRALAQCYLAWGGALNGFVDKAQMNKRDTERARFVVSLLIDAMSPTNWLGGNPTALKKVVDTGGGSLVHGLENLLGDLANNGGLPAQVDTRKFAVGKNLATTPGSVVYRSPVMELIQYRPVNAGVHARPLLIAPPQINKFYVFDLAPEKSIIQFALKHDLQTFAISWKNPTAAESHFGLDTYVGALEEAVDAMRDITGSDDVNIWGSCSGGITMSAFLANLAARGEHKVHSATVAVCVLDMGVAENTTAGIFITPESIIAAKTASQLTGVLEGRELARMFAWMRPNDLIWNYWVNNYLLGNTPPAFDILYWNNDTTRLAAKLHADFLDLIDSNPYVNPGRLNVRGMPLDMSAVNMDSYVVAGLTDHITPWQGCYNTAKLFGERSTFVLANSGHIQSLLNPPGNPKAFFWAGPTHQPSAAPWLEQSGKHSGSWWPHWLEWISARSGEKKPAPAALGSADYPALDDAPGVYVMEK